MSNSTVYMSHWKDDRIRCSVDYSVDDDEYALQLMWRRRFLFWTYYEPLGREWMLFLYESSKPLNKHSITKGVMEDGARYEICDYHNRRPLYRALCLCDEYLSLIHI